MSTEERTNSRGGCRIFFIKVACCLKMRWESKVTLRKNFRIVEGRIVPAMFIEDGREILEWKYQ